MINEAVFFCITVKEYSTWVAKRKRSVENNNLRSLLVNLR